MMPNKAVSGVPILLVILLAGCAKATVHSSQPSPALWLIQQFETVFYSRIELLSSSGGYKNLSKENANTLRAPFAYLPVALNALGRDVSADVFANGEAVLVGAKDFRPPAGLGAVYSQLCYVIVLRNRSAFDFHKYFHQSTQITVDGVPIWNWSVKLGEFGENDPRPSSFYATQVAQSYALVCNDPGDLRAIAGQLASPGGDSQNLNGLTGWETVGHHEVWGYRRYRHTGIADRQAAGMNGITPSAQALLFFADARRNVGLLRLLASDVSTADGINAAMMKSKAALPTLKSSGPGAWEAVIPFTGDPKSNEVMFDVMGLFGFGIYL